MQFSCSRIPVQLIHIPRRCQMAQTGILKEPLPAALELDLIACNRMCPHATKGMVAMAQVQGTEQEWLMVAEAAGYLRVSRNTIYRWAKQGRIILYKIGSAATRLRKKDLETLARPIIRGPSDPWTQALLSSLRCRLGQPRRCHLRRLEETVWLIKRVMSSLLFVDICTVRTCPPETGSETA